MLLKSWTFWFSLAGKGCGALKAVKGTAAALSFAGPSLGRLSVDWTPVRFRNVSLGNGGQLLAMLKASRLSRAAVCGWGAWQLPRLCTLHGYNLSRQAAAIYRTQLAELFLEQQMLPWGANRTGAPPPIQDSNKKEKKR